jgi:hypothetical protein
MRECIDPHFLMKLKPMPSGSIGSQTQLKV